MKAVWYTKAPVQPLLAHHTCAKRPKEDLAQTPMNVTAFGNVAFAGAIGYAEVILWESWFQSTMAGVCLQETRKATPRKLTMRK